MDESNPHLPCYCWTGSDTPPLPRKRSGGGGESILGGDSGLVQGGAPGVCVGGRYVKRSTYFGAGVGERGEEK